MDHWVPTHYLLPTGQQVPITYSKADSSNHTPLPSVSCLIQQLFGLDHHPTLGPGRVPLLFNLLALTAYTPGQAKI